MPWTNAKLELRSSKTLQNQCFRVCVGGQSDRSNSTRICALIMEHITQIRQVFRRVILKYEEVKGLLPPVLYLQVDGVQA